MFPFSIEGEIEVVALGASDTEPFLTRLEDALNTEKAHDIKRTGSMISFRAGIFHAVWDRHVLKWVGYGEIEVTPGDQGMVRYKFSLVQLLVVTMLVAGLLGYFVTMNSGTLVAGIVVGAGFWLSIFGMIYVLSLVSLPGFVIEIVKHSKEDVG